MGLLIFGADPMRVAMKRQEVIAAVIGPEGEAEMRLTRLSGGRPAPRSGGADGCDQGAGVLSRPARGLRRRGDRRPGPGSGRARWPTGGRAMPAAWSRRASLPAKSALRKLFESTSRGPCTRPLRRSAGAGRDRGGAGEGRAGRHRARGDGRSHGAGAGARPRRFPPDAGKDRALQAGRPDAADAGRHRRLRARRRSRPRWTTSSTPPPRAGRPPSAR